MSEPRDKPAEAPEPSLLTVLVMGAASGLAVGWTFLAWEAVIGWRLGLVAPTGAARDTVLWLYLGLGGGTGLVMGALGLKRGAWAIAMACVASGYLLSSKLGMLLADAGLPVSSGLVLLIIGAVAGLLLARSAMSDAARLAVAVSLFVALALGLPINLHLLPSPFAPLAIAIDTGIAVIALAFGGAYFLWVSRVSRSSGVLVPVALANLVALAIVFMAPPPHRQVTTPSALDAAPIVLIVVDTLRADHVGAYGYARDVSPNLDQLARQSIVYEQAGSAAPWTLPAMGSLMTGRTPGRHGAGVNPGSGNALTGLGGETTTLAAELSQAGYRTVGVTTNPWVSSGFGFARGFDIYDDRVGPFALPVAVHPLVTLGIDPLGRTDFRRADAITDAALSQLETLGDTGWFLYVHYMDVHGPHQVDQEDAVALDLPDSPTYADLYDGSLRFADRHIGRLLEQLPSNAMVIVTADHGEQLGEMRDAPPQAPANVRHGHTLYEELLHVPLFIRVPGVRGRRVQRLVSLTDVLPSVMARLGLELPNTVEGQVWVELDATAGVDPDRIVIAEGLRWGAEQKSARRGRYKLITGGRDVELYDLVVSPYEATQLGMAEQGSTTILRELRAALPATGAESVGVEAQIGTDLRALLQRLGYADP